MESTLTKDSSRAIQDSSNTESQSKKLRYDSRQNTIESNQMNSIFGIIRNESLIAVNRLYGDSDSVGKNGSWTCKAIFQSLSSISQAILMRLVFRNDHVDRKLILDWLQSSSKVLGNSAISELMSLRILLPQLDDMVSVNKHFLLNFRRSLCSDEEPWETKSHHSSTINEGENPSIEILDDHSSLEWERILYFLATSDEDAGKKIKSATKNLLISTQLMMLNSDGSLMITAKGYEFMLKDLHSQVTLIIICLLLTLFLS